MATIAPAIKDIQIANSHIGWLDFLSWLTIIIMKQTITDQSIGQLFAK